MANMPAAEQPAAAEELPTLFMNLRPQQKKTPESGPLPIDSTEIACTDKEQCKANAATNTETPRHWAVPIALGAVQLLLGFGVIFTIFMPSCFKDVGPSEDCSHPGLPGGIAFDLLEVVVIGYIGGQMVSRLAGLPPLFGMLLAGYVLKNILPDQLEGLSPGTNSSLRNVALAVIMLRAGMGLNIAKLRENAVRTLLLAVFPCLCEAFTIALFAKLVFPVMSPVFCLMLGFVISDVSPAVTTPILIDFMSQGLGVSKGIPTILLAAGSVNSVVAIVFYSVVNEFAWDGPVSAGRLVEIIGVNLILQIVGVGVVAGWAFGRFIEFCWRFTPREYERFVILALVSLLMLFGFKQVGMGGGGTLAVLMCGATLQNSVSHPDVTKPVSDMIGMLWANCGSIFLFTLLGASVDQSRLDGSMLALAMLTILIGLVGRCVSVFGTTSLMREWNMKEKVFAMVATCPKATVQAALATVALDFVNEKIAAGEWDIADSYTKDMLERGNVILTTAVLSIIMTAPLFAVLMTFAGERLLERNEQAVGESKEVIAAENQGVVCSSPVSLDAAV